MVQDQSSCDLGSIDECDESADNEKPFPPDRSAFQRELSWLNHQLANFRHEIEVLVGRDGREGTISATIQRKNSIRKERESLAKEAELVKRQIGDLRRELDAKRSMQIELERDCRVRSLEKIESYLKTNEERYRTKNLSRKEEQLLVQEIDALKRNRIKLEKLDEIMKSRGSIEANISTLKKSNEDTYRKILKLKAEQLSASSERKRYGDQLANLRKQLSDMYYRRKTTISTYDNERSVYAEWLRKHKRPPSYPATFPSVHRMRNSSICVEEEELEPFYEQKRDCRRLVSYLERLGRQTETDKAIQQAHSKDVESGSDSADEFPASFSRLSIPPSPSKSTTSTPTTSVDVSRKHKKLKSNQPVSHVFEIYNLFGTVDVEAPTTYQDVPHSLEQVRARLAGLERETNVIQWDEELKCLGSLDMSRSVSEFTDSACPDSASDCTSLMSFQHSDRKSNVDSPQPRLQMHSTSDEGVSSAHSNGPPPVNLIEEPENEDKVYSS